MTEDGSFIQRYVYDENGSRISAEFNDADGTARGTANAKGEYGENPASDVAVNDIGKVWYRTSLLNSTLFAVDANGAVVAHMIYDPWGQPLTETYIDTNRSGLDNLNNYTGYSWDETLGLYYAQNRFYDADNHRFTQEDTVKDGANWYVYCGNEPTLNIDMTGLCFFDANGNWRHDNWEYSGGYQMKKDPKNFMLQYGSSGYAVSELQRLLAKYDYLKSNKDIDGSFGSKTLSAVKVFQGINGLVIDGYVGPQTWNKLLSKNTITADGFAGQQKARHSSLVGHADYYENTECEKNSKQGGVVGFGISGGAGLALFLQGSILYVSDSYGNEGILFVGGAGGGLGYSYGGTYASFPENETIFELEGPGVSIGFSAIAVGAEISAGKDGEGGNTTGGTASFAPPSLSGEFHATITGASLITIKEVHR